MNPTQLLSEILKLLDGASEGPAPERAAQLLAELTSVVDMGRNAPDVVRAIHLSGVLEGA